MIQADKPLDELLYWISNNKFKKEAPCWCDFDGNWLGDGICIGCRHPVEYFKDGQCTFPTMRDMSTKEVKESIIQHITELIVAGGRSVS